MRDTGGPRGSLDLDVVEQSVVQLQHRVGVLGLVHQVDVLALRCVRARGKPAGLHVRQVCTTASAGR